MVTVLMLPSVCSFISVSHNVESADNTSFCGSYGSAFNPNESHCSFVRSRHGWKASWPFCSGRYFPISKISPMVRLAMLLAPADLVLSAVGAEDWEASACSDTDDVGNEVGRTQLLSAKILVALAVARKIRGNLNNIIMLHYEVGFGVTAGGAYFSPNTACSRSTARWQACSLVMRGCGSSRPCT